MKLRLISESPGRLNWLTNYLEDQHIAQTLYQLDPDTKKTNTRFLANLYKTGKISIKGHTTGSEIILPEDGERVKETLTAFMKQKTKLPVKSRDINRYKSFHELEDIINTDTTTETSEVSAEPIYQQGGNSIIKINKLNGNGDEAKIELLQKLGEGTKWCTRGSYKNCMAESYLNEGDIYVFRVNKRPVAQLFLHDIYNSDDDTGSTIQLMDVNDREIDTVPGMEEQFEQIKIKYYEAIDNEIRNITDSINLTDSYESVKLLINKLLKMVDVFDAENNIDLSFDQLYNSVEVLMQKALSIVRFDKYFDRVEFVIQYFDILISNDEDLADLISDQYNLLLKQYDNTKYKKLLKSINSIDSAELHGISRIIDNLIGISNRGNIDTSGSIEPMKTKVKEIIKDHNRIDDLPQLYKELDNIDGTSSEKMRKINIFLYNYV